MSRCVIVGATSAMAVAIAREFAARGDELHLLGRQPQRLDALSRDLPARGAVSVTWAEFAAESNTDYQAVADTA